MLVNVVIERNFGMNDKNPLAARYLSHWYVKQKDSLWTLRLFNQKAGNIIQLMKKFGRKMYLNQD